MFQFLAGVLGSRSDPKRRTPARRQASRGQFRPGLERLERRDVPTGGLLVGPTLDGGHLLTPAAGPDFGPSTLVRTVNVVSGAPTPTLASTLIQAGTVGRPASGPLLQNPPPVPPVPPAPPDGPGETVALPSEEQKFADAHGGKNGDRYRDEDGAWVQDYKDGSQVKEKTVRVGTEGATKSTTTVINGADGTTTITVLEKDKDGIVRKTSTAEYDKDRQKTKQTENSDSQGKTEWTKDATTGEWTKTVTPPGGEPSTSTSKTGPEKTTAGLPDTAPPPSTKK